MTDDKDAAFTEFAMTARRQLYRTAWMLCCDSHRAQDLVQETLTKVYVAWDRRARIANPAGYAHRTLVRTYIDASRRRRWHEKPTETAIEGVVEGEDLALRTTLTEALGQLERPDRIVVVLRYLQDRSADEVAELLGVSPGAVRQRSARALSKLKDIIGCEFNDLVP